MLYLTFTHIVILKRCHLVHRPGVEHRSLVFISPSLQLEILIIGWKHFLHFLKKTQIDPPWLEDDYSWFPFSFSPRCFEFIMCRSTNGYFLLVWIHICEDLWIGLTMDTKSTVSSISVSTARPPVHFSLSRTFFTSVFPVLSKRKITRISERVNPASSQHQENACV